MAGLLQLSPFIRVASDSIIEPPGQLPERVIFDYELLYVKEGTIKVNIEEQTYEAGPGNIFLFKPGQRHSFVLVGNQPLHQPHLHFDLFYQEDSERIKVSFKNKGTMSAEELVQIRKDDTAPGSPMELPNLIAVSNISYFEKLLFDIIHEFDVMSPFYQIQVNSMFLRLWTYLLRETHIANNEDIYRWIKEYQPIKQYVAQNFDRAITLGELSERFHISPYHLLRIYKKIYGLTPAQYSRMVRITKAKEMISFSNMSIKEISIRLGFSSINTFCRTFHQIEGVSPSFYRCNNPH